MEILENQIIGELVAKDYRTASIFKKYGIDFCCKGNRTINEACEDKSINTKSILSDLKNIAQVQEGNTTDFKSWPLDLLADYVEKKHHRYVEQKILEIKPFLDKICKVHGANHPELLEINKHFKDTSDELTKHMKKEELIIFPYIRALVQAKQKGTKVNTPHFGTVKNPIEMMMQEHVAEGERFEKIAELSNKYTPPADGCTTYRVTYAMLKEFEDDLHLHIHIENNILFPKAIELEKELEKQVVN
ncbi:MAG: iron-sulfur cluster repair di-iron protein [Bacteroidia bacterium]